MESRQANVIRIKITKNSSTSVTGTCKGQQTGAGNFRHQLRKKDSPNRTQEAMKTVSSRTSSKG